MKDSPAAANGDTELGRCLAAPILSCKCWDRAAWWPVVLLKGLPCPVTQQITRLMM